MVTGGVVIFFSYFFVVFLGLFSKNHVTAGLTLVFVHKAVMWRYGV
jgi:hypothetical protein